MRTKGIAHTHWGYDALYAWALALGADTLWAGGALSLHAVDSDGVISSKQAVHLCRQLGPRQRHFDPCREVEVVQGHTPARGGRCRHRIAPPQRRRHKIGGGPGESGGRRERNGTAVVDRKPSV